MLYCDPRVSGSGVIMTSNFELRMLAKLVHEDAITKAQQRNLVHNMKKLSHGASNECPELVIREMKPCQC
jgi:hypothetical protein